VEYALRQADGLLVTTPALEERLQAFNPAIQVAPHALDERLLVPRRPAPARRRKVIGYMGTRTHDDDLLMIAPALQAVCRRHPEVELQLIGVADRPAARQALSGLPARWIEVPADETEYPLFLMWFSGQVGWHIGLAPLVDSPFNQVKSDIKLLDYAAIAAAGVFSRGPAYAGSVRHLENGWLAENTPPAWEEALERLLADEPLRLELARAANLELYTRRTLAQAAPRWAQAFDALLPGGD
jgi:glycosyltransferase involved in cell wall biosynthesis